MRSYDVYYTLFDQESPYYWNICLVDTATGNLLVEDFIRYSETYETDDTEYVVLAGQGSTIEHDYFSPQRSYTVYYRDVNDLQNADTVVTREEVVSYDNPVTVQEVVYEDEYVDEYEYVDQIVPADDASQDDSADTASEEEQPESTTTLEDETTPLAQLPADADSSNGSSMNMPLIIGGIAAAAVIIIAGAAFIIVRKKGGAK